MTKENVCYCGEYGGGVHTKSARCADPPPSKELAYRDALARIRQVCRSDAKDFEAATIERRRVYDIANMTLDANGDLYASGHEPPAVQGPCPNCGAKWVSAELSTSQEPQSELPKPINHDLWRHLHDEHGLTLVQSELDEILRLSQPPGQDVVTAAQAAAEFLRRYCPESSGRNLIIADVERATSKKGADQC
jgi:hypothetical protein